MAGIILRSALDRGADLRLLVMMLALLCLSFPSVAAPVIAELRVGSHVIKAEIANTETSRAQGLMYRNSICENCGMLFVFPEVGKHRFRMKSTSIPLSIAFLSSNGSIIRIDDMQPGSEEVHEGLEGGLYALEMAAGWFARNEVSIGAEVHDIKLMAYFVSIAE